MKDQEPLAMLSRRRIVPWLIVLGMTTQARAQFGAGPALQRPSSRSASSADVEKTLKEPAESRVFQRDENDQATIPVVLADDLKDAEIVSARLTNLAGPSSISYR